MKLRVPTVWLFSLLWALVWVPLFFAVSYDLAEYVGGVMFFGWAAGAITITALRIHRQAPAETGAVNDKGREIWFRRVMWSYMPAHWKGVVYPAAIVIVAVPLCLLADDFNPFLPFVPLLLAIGFVFWICERHSPARR